MSCRTITFRLPLTHILDVNDVDQKGVNSDTA